MWPKKRAKSDWNVIKIVIFVAKSHSGWALCALWYAKLLLWYAWVASVYLARGLNWITFVQKNFTFGLNPLPLSRILVALLVAFTAAERFFERLYGTHKKRCRLSASLFFSDMNTKFFKYRVISSRKISVFMWKSLVYFSAHPSIFG